jgi:fatty-acyl-CoA synthase
VEDRSVGSWVERRARVSPDAVALVHGATRRTYGELAARISHLAAAWRQLGVQRGDRVVWRGPNHPAFLESFFAAARLGAALAPVNHLLDPATTVELVTDYAPTLVVEHAVERIDLPGRATRVAIDPSGQGLAFESLVTSSPSTVVDQGVDPSAACLIPHTSGTTGRPRGVVLTHRNVTANVVNMLSVADLRNDEVTVAVAPLFRTGGVGVNVLPVLFKGGTVVVPEASEPEALLRLIEEERVTVGFGNPDLLDALARSPAWPDADLSSIRWIVTGGSPVPERLVRTYQSRGLTFLQGYGLSEAAPVVLLLDARHALDKPGSAGTPPMFVDVRTARPDGAPCDTGEAGELEVRGPNVMAGYWHDDEATRRAFTPDGWLRTGDAARVDADGFVWIVDRVADAFEVRGRRVYPGDVERVLLDQPGVSDAGVSADGAFVVLEPDSSTEIPQLLAACRARLAPEQVPSRIVVVDTLPRSPVGKLVRSRLGSTGP